MADFTPTQEREKAREKERKRGEEKEAAEVQSTNRITGSRRWWALAAVLITIFFGSLDQTVVSTAMPVIIGDLKGFDIYAWVFTAYLMTSTITVPIYGKLSDVYGRKPFYVFGLSVFIIGSALSGQAHSMIELIIFRGLQGIGAGAMLSMPRATIGDIFTPRERGRWMGVISMTFGLSSLHQRDHRYDCPGYGDRGFTPNSECRGSKRFPVSRYGDRQCGSTICALTRGRDRHTHPGHGLNQQIRRPNEGEPACDTAKGHEQPAALSAAGIDRSTKSYECTDPGSYQK